MITRLLLSFLLAIIALNTLSAQGFEKTTTFRRIARITATADGGAIAIGSVRAANGLEQMAAARYTANGTLLWLAQKDWGTVDASAFALTPDDTGGWWVQGKPTILSHSAPICNWHLNADGSEVAFFSGEGGLVHDALLLGDTLWKATALYNGPIAIAVSPVLTSPAFASYPVWAGGVANTDYLTTHRIKPAANGDLYMGGGLLTWLYGQVQINSYLGYYISALYPYLSVIKPLQDTIIAKTYPFKGSNVKDFVVLPDGQARAITQKIWFTVGATDDTSYLLATNSNLELTWSKPFRNRRFEQITTTPDGTGTVVCGTLNRGNQRIAVLGKYGPTGDLIWEREFGNALSTAVTTDMEGNYWLAVTPASGLTRLYKTDDQGQRRSNGLRGRVFQDNDQNCAFSPTIDGPLPGFRLVLVTDGDTLTTFSAPDGTFALPADTGVQRLLIFPDNPNYVRCQPDLLDFSFPGGTYDTLDFALGFRDTCPNLRVKAATDLACGPGSGRAAFRVSGGSGEYDFHWNTGSTDSLLTNLNAGIYWATISENGCETYDTLQVKFDFQAIRLGLEPYGSQANSLPRATAASADGQYFYLLGNSFMAIDDVDSTHGLDDIWVVKTDRTGQKIWIRNFGGSNQDLSTDLVVAADGGIVIVGDTESNDGDFANGGEGQRPFLLKISPDGDLLWVHKLDTAFSLRMAAKVVAAPNGDFLAGGQSLQIIPGYNRVMHLWLARFDADGNLLWHQQYGTGRSAYLNGLIVDGVNGGYVANCSMYEGADIFHFIKISETGEVVWQRQDERLNHGPISQMLNGGFLVGSSVNTTPTSKPALIRTNPLGMVDTVVLLPAATYSFASLIRTGTNSWAALITATTSYILQSSAIVRFDDQLHLNDPINLPFDAHTSLKFLYYIGTDSFFLTGLGNFPMESGPSHWLSAQVQVFPRHPALLAADTLVCPGTTIAFGLDSLAGSYTQIGWENTETPAPASLVVGTQDTVLRVFAQNAEGCVVVADRTIRTDKFRTELQVDGTTCTLENGRIWLEITNNLGPIHIIWADGTSQLAYRDSLMPGVYPVMVSDSFCSQHFSPEVKVSDAPLFSHSTTPYFFHHGYGWAYTNNVRLTELANGNLIQWGPQYDGLSTGIISPIGAPPLTLPNNYSFSNVVALPDTTFMVVGYPNIPYSAHNMLHFDQFGQSLGNYRLPFGTVADLVPLATGGYLVAGDSVSSGPNGRQIVVARLNEQFQPIWLTLLPSSDNRSEGARRMVVLPDGRIVVASQSTLPNLVVSTVQRQDVKISVLDASGVLQNSHIWGGESDDLLSDIAATNDGDLIVSVLSYSHEGDLAGVNTADGATMWFFRLNADNQQIVWQRTEPQAEKMSHFPGGTLLYRTASPIGPAGPTNERLHAISPQGDEIWSVRTVESQDLRGVPFCRANGDILFPHIQVSNYVSSGSHCCPSADFHVSLDIYRNGQIPQPFDLGPDTTICIGDTLTLSATAANAYVTWSPGLYGPTLEVTRAGIYVARAGSVCPFTDSVRVDYCLYASLPDSVTGCAPLVINSGMPGLAHQWSNGSTSETLSLTESAWLGLTVTNLAGQTVHDSVFATVYPISTYETEEQDILCYGVQNGLLSVSTSGEGKPYTYMWSSGQQDSLLTGLSAGDYGVTVTDAFGCTFMEQFNITESPFWNMDAYANPSNDSITYGASANISGAIPGPVTWQWSNGATANYINYPGGLLSLTITDANGCAKSDTIDLPFLVSVKNPLTAQDLRVFPNPASEEFFIENLGKTPESVTIRDMTGREITLDTQTETAPNGGLRLRVSCQSWAAGVYSVALRWNEGTAVVRVVKVGL